MSFARPVLLALAVVLPLLLAFLLWRTARRRRAAADALGDAPLVARLAGADAARLPRWRPALLLPAAALLGLAAAGPRIGAASGGGGAADVVLVLDASASMRVADVAPSRLERERTLARGLLRALPDARVGVVAFAGRGYVLSPLTTDPSALEMYLDALSPEMVTQGGSSLAGAIREGAGLLYAGGKRPESAAMVLVTDGEALEEREAVLDAARRARTLGLPVHTVGIGTAAGGPVPDLDPATGRVRGWKTDPTTGGTAISRLDEPLLREVARRSGGTYFGPASSAREIAAAIGGNGGGGGGREDGPADRYAWPLSLALALLALDSLLERRRPRRPR